MTARRPPARARTRDDRERDDGRAVDRWEFALPGGLGAPRAARRLLTDALGERLGDDDLDDVLVLVSELVSNAVRHAGAHEDDAVPLVAALADGVLRIEVRDRGPGFARPEVPEARPDGGGNGFVLLERLTEAWGVVNGDPTCVWFERGLSARCPRSAP